MGKKRIIQKSEEELLKERDRVEEVVKKDVKVETTQRVKEGKVYILSSYNNTIITLTDMRGGVLGWFGWQSGETRVVGGDRVVHFDQAVQRDLNDI